MERVKTVQLRHAEQGKGLKSTKISLFHRSVRVKLMTLLIAFTVVTTVFTGFWLYQRTSSQLMEDAWRQQEALLKTTCVSMDQQLEQLNSFSWQLSNDRSVETFLFLSDQTPSHILIKKDLIETLKNMKAFSNTLCDIGIYFSKLDLIITSESSFSSKDYYEKIDFLSLKGIQEVLHQNTETSLCLFAGLSTIHRVMSQDSVLVFASSLPMNSPYQQGFAFYHLQIEKLKNFLPESENGVLLLADSQGNPLLPCEDEAVAEVCRLFMKGGQKTIRYGGREYGVMARKTIAPGLVCIAVVPYSQLLAPAERTKQLTMLVMGVCMLAGVLAAVFASQKMYAPLEQLLRQVDQMGHLLSGQRQTNEYALLSDAIRLIAEENHTLTLSNQETIRLLKNKLLPEWMEGRMRGDWQSVLAQAQIFLPYQRVQAAVIEISFRESERLREELGQNVPDWIERAQTEADYGPMRIWCAQRTDGCLLVLFNLDVDHPCPELIYQFLEKCCERFSVCTACKIGIGRAYGTESAADSLVDAMMALRCGKRTDERALYYAEEIVLPSAQDYPLSAEQQLLNYITSGQKEETHRFLKNFCESRDNAPLLKRNVAQALLFTALRAAKQAGVESAFEESLEQTGLSSSLLPMGEETLQQLSTVFDTIMEALPSNASSQEKILYQKLMDYLLREYQNDISLDTASAALSLSPSYIGLIFRKVGGTSFLRMLTDLRISKAKSLLCETQLTVREVGAMVGIENQNTFIRMFKKSEGITPGQFRVANSTMNSPIG